MLERGKGITGPKNGLKNTLPTSLEVLVCFDTGDLKWLVGQLME